MRLFKRTKKENALKGLSSVYCVVDGCLVLTGYVKDFNLNKLNGGK